MVGGREGEVVEGSGLTRFYGNGITRHTGFGGGGKPRSAVAVGNAAIEPAPSSVC